MGTRSLTHIKDGDLESETIVTIYRQFDGYLAGMGKDLLNLLYNKSIVNGFSLRQNNYTCFNGMGCLAAYIVKNLKEDIGDVYIHPVNSSHCGEEYTYTLYKNETDICIRAVSEYRGKILYDGPINDFDIVKAQEVEDNELEL